MHKTIVAAAALLLTGAGVCIAQPPGITRDMIERSLPLDGAPVFSPSGTLIAFERGSYVYTIRPNGSGLHRVVAGQNPSWQPIP